MTPRILGLITALTLFAGAASAETWRLAQATSSLAFSYLENGATIEGAFTNFDGEARFGREDLTDATVSVRVATESVSFGHPLRDHFARSVDWFDTETHPVAAFELTGLTPIGDGRHRAAGLLDIRGVQHPVDATLQIRRAPASITAEGELVFPRSAFGVGTGFSSMLADIGDAITVRFDLVGVRAD